MTLTSTTTCVAMYVVYSVFFFVVQDLIHRAMSIMYMNCLSNAYVEARDTLALQMCVVVCVYARILLTFSKSFRFFALSLSLTHWHVFGAHVFGWLTFFARWR